MRLHQIIKILPLILLCLFHVAAQQTNPVDRQVSNPMTDTPNVNPISQDQDIKAPKKKQSNGAQDGADDELVVYSEKQTGEGANGKRIVVHSGNVDVHYGPYRLQADKITVYEAESRMVAEGNVIFDQGDDQRITGTRGEFNYKTKLGFFIDTTGFTNQTEDGTVMYFTADRVERVGVNELHVVNGKFTACGDDAVPKWSFTADEAKIKLNDRVKLKNVKFRVRDIPLIPLPYVSISIKKEDRSSGFLTPTFGFSGNKGFRLSGAYYQTLGRSADVTIRGDLFTSRGIGYGMDFRTRANSRSYLNFGFYAVKDRILGAKEDADHLDQGGSLVYANGVHYFQNGFTAVADVNLTSNLAFRQVFSDNIQQVISPIEVSQVFVSKSWNSYTLDLLARSQVISIPNLRVKTRNLPSVNFEKRPTEVSFLKNVYFSFKTSFEGISRRESVDDVDLYRQQTGGDPVVTSAYEQRFDIHPQISVPFNTRYFSLTATAGTRVTYYSTSFDDMRRVTGQSITRKYGEFELDFRPVALAKNYYGENNAFRFRHVIEPFLIYRFIKGVNNFNRIIRFDYEDTQTDTNEIEYGVTNRIYTRRYTEAVTKEAQQKLQENPGQAKNPLSIQPYEVFTFTVRGKYFFDPLFGGALTPGQRNQIEPITALTFYTFGGVPRRFSPINIDATYRPRKKIFVNTRMDVELRGEILRDISATIGYDTKLLKFFQTFYYTRAVTLIPSLQQYALPGGKEAGTLRGSQWSPSLFMGNRDKGWYGGASLFFDFENSRTRKTSPLISSLFTIGYASDCCAVTMQYSNYNVGVRRENRLIFSFKLNGIGTFGTQQIGQGLR